MDFTNGHFVTTERFLWASMLWGAIASGYCVYGWRQKSGIPLGAGAVMTVASIFLSAFWMTVVCVAAMFAVWWLLKQGY